MEVSVEEGTLLYGARDLTTEELHLDPASGRNCWDCDMTPQVFLANPRLLRQAGSWPTK